MGRRSVRAETADRLVLAFEGKQELAEGRAGAPLSRDLAAQPRGNFAIGSGLLHSSKSPQTLAASLERVTRSGAYGSNAASDFYAGW